MHLWIIKELKKKMAIMAVLYMLLLYNNCMLHVVEQLNSYLNSFCNHASCTWKDATSYRDAYFGESSGPYHLESVRCNGYEATLLNCSRQYTTGGMNNQGIGVHDCAPGNEAGVKCDGMFSQIWVLLHLHILCKGFVVHQHCNVRLFTFCFL